MKEIIAAIVTAIGSLLGVIFKINRESKLNRITDERKKWRNEMRKIVTQLSVMDIDNLNRPDKKRLCEITTMLKLRINPYGYKRKNYMKDSHLWESISILEDEKKRTNGEKNKLIQYISLLLKYDWERSKTESSFNWIAIVGYCIYIVSNVFLAYTISINYPETDTSIILGFLIVFSIIFFIPEMYLALLKYTVVYFLDLFLCYGISGVILICIFYINKDSDWLLTPLILQGVSLLLLFISNLQGFINRCIYINRIKKISQEQSQIIIFIKNICIKIYYFIRMIGDRIMKNNKISWIINLVHIAVVILILFAVFRAVFCVDTGLFNGPFWKSLIESIKLASLTEWFTFVGAIAFVLFGINGIYEFCYSNGIKFLVPPIYQNAKDTILLKQAEKMMKVYYDKDIDFIKTYEDERTDKILNMLQLTDKQFHHVRYEIIKARAGNISNLKSLQEKTKDLLLNKEYIVDLTKYDASERVYGAVQYYIDLYTALLDENIYEDAGRLMTNFLKIECKKELGNIDCLIIPYGSNLLLGLSVAKKLGIRLVSILEESRKLNAQSWDGDYPINKDGSKIKIAILHDVLVSGERIYKSLEKLPPNSYEIVGLFSLVYYETDKNDPFDTLEKHSIPKEKVHSIVKVSDGEMEEIINE